YYIFLWELIVRSHIPFGQVTAAEYFWALSILGIASEKERTESPFWFVYSEPTAPPINQGETQKEFTWLISHESVSSYCQNIASDFRILYYVVKNSIKHWRQCFASIANLVIAEENKSI
ncbi:hypothetical protein SDJN02_14370, partial [Cucurbita argyrosperma subsp. argyrosperma]